MDPNNSFVTDEMVRAEIERQRAYERARRLVTTAPTIANDCRLCEDAEAAPGHTWCQGCIDREDIAENALYHAGVYRCPECLGLMDADGMVCEECALRFVGEARLIRDIREARPSLLDSINVWIDAHRTAFWVVMACGVAYSLFAWMHRA